MELSSSGTRVVVLGGGDVRALLPMTTCIHLMERAFRALARGDAVQPLRLALRQPDGRNAVAAMPAYLGDPAVVGAKLITVFPDNAARGLASHQGIVTVHDPEQGTLLAIVDATAMITALRTAAVSALATRLLARQDTAELALLGSGVQAAFHLAAMHAVRPVRRVRAWSPTASNAARFAGEQSGRYGAPVVAVGSPREALDGADLVCTTTAAREPIAHGAWLAAGAHVNAVGASVPGFRELDTPAVARSRLFVDRRESALAEADDVRIPLREGAIAPAHIAGELAELVTGTIVGRTTPAEITLFKSVGLAIEDLAAAHHVYTEAVRLGRGAWVSLAH